MKLTTIATVVFVAAASAHSPVPVGSFNITHNNVAEPSPGWVNGTYTPRPNKKVGVQKAETYSAGEFYAAPTITAESTTAFPTDTSKVSVTIPSLPEAMTGLAEKEVHNGASPMASAGGVVSVLAALVSFSWLF
ncbi:MAG: hypothetical protein HETSPECPRED_006775 [Heterodermia speciosa]|uniref:Uncharacterized protein n=1 Tax=Heterodermia speciosa TaxID=116794 RepID=A0A8H3FSD5_9LECA|nr:MAG: hypothetical protein HETSPECPRED_006775 [Heterodermia speciosa]